MQTCLSIRSRDLSFRIGDIVDRVSLGTSFMDPFDFSWRSVGILTNVICAIAISPLTTELKRVFVQILNKFPEPLAHSPSTFQTVIAGQIKRYLSSSSYPFFRFSVLNCSSSVVAERMWVVDRIVQIAAGVIGGVFFVTVITCFGRCRHSWVATLSIAQRGIERLGEVWETSAFWGGGLLMLGKRGLKRAAGQPPVQLL